MRLAALLRVSIALVAIETLGLAILTAWQVVAIAGGDTDSLTSALALVVLSAVGTAVMGAFTVGIARGLSWGRSGAIVAQILTLAVAGGAGTGEFAHPALAWAIALPAFAVLLVLVVLAWKTGQQETRDADS